MPDDEKREKFIMSKRKREAIEQSAAEKAAEYQQTIEPSNSTKLIKSSVSIHRKWKNRWRNLSGQGKLLAVLFIGILSLGTFGAGMKYLEEDAKRVIAQRNASTRLNPSEEGWFSKLNPFVPSLSPSPTPQLSKEYIYAGSRLLAVEDASANAAPPADLAVWRPSTGTWWVMGGQGSQQVSVQWGLSSDKPAPGDYDGDGKTDFSIFRPTEGNWYVQRSSDNTLLQYNFGVGDDKLAQADYDGDGRTDPAVFRPSNGYWYILRSSDSGITYQQFGLSSDTTASADYDGDGRADIGVWRSSNNTFYALASSNQTLQTAVFTQSSSEPVSADYDGDGRADYAIRNSTNWIILNSSTNQTQTISWQQSTDKAVPNDYDGDGKVDVAVWRDATGNWYIRKSSDSQLRQEAWGMSGDIPVPAYYRR